MTDYALWEVIVNGDSPPPKRNVDGVEQTYPPTTVEENLAKKNKLKERDYETEVKGSSSSNQNSQNVAFVSSNNSGSSNQAYGSNSANADSMSDAVIYSFFVNQSNSLQLNDEDLQHMMLMNRKPYGLTNQKWNVINCHKKGHFAREYMALRENRNREPIRRIVIVETTEIKALVAQDGLRYDWSDQAEEGPINFALMAYTSSGSSSYSSSDSEIQVSDKFKTGVGFDSQVVDSQVFDSQENDRYKTSEGYHAVPPPYTGNFMPPKYDLVLADEGEYVFSESVTSIPDAATSEAKTSVSKPKSVGEPLIEDWISDTEDENETEFKSKQRKPTFAKIEFVKSNEHVKTLRESVKKVENKKQAKYPRKNSYNLRGNQRNWNNLMTQKLGSNFEFKNKACYECGSFNHLTKDCDLYEKKMVEKTVWNNARRANHQNSQRMTHPHPKGNFIPKAVLMKSGIKSFNTAGQNFSKAAGNVTTAGPKAVVSDNKGNKANPVKASTCWVWRPKQKVLDHVSRHNGASMSFKRFDYVDAQGRSKHMTGNKSYLLDYEEIDGGFVAFGGDPKGGRITGKGKISTSKLDFEDVYFVKELKFNLFSVSQMCDKKNSVLFTDTECVVLSPDFKLLDENHVLLRVPRKDNMYSVDLKNIVITPPF
ncbi:ribonuclease H-like domain-containing protein [Tanacetum coccineum]